MTSVREAYDKELLARGYASDPAQLRAIDALDRCAREWAAFKEQRSNAFKKLINR
ncbi:MAG: cell division protein ZapE, partial [Serpentinimonas sp.]|nr:cell division protein ZapE [Serpentinimonas sp.]